MKSMQHLHVSKSQNRELVVATVIINGRYVKFAAVHLEAPTSEGINMSHVIMLIITQHANAVAYLKHYMYKIIISYIEQSLTLYRDCNTLTKGAHNVRARQLDLCQVFLCNCPLKTSDK